MRRLPLPRSRPAPRSSSFIPASFSKERASSGRSSAGFWANSRKRAGAASKRCAAGAPRIGRKGGLPTFREKTSCSAIMPVAIGSAGVVAPAACRISLVKIAGSWREARPFQKRPAGKEKCSDDQKAPSGKAHHDIDQLSHGTLFANNAEAKRQTWL